MLGHPHIVLTAGGTGGHTFPAEAVAAALIKKGYRVTLITDKRYLTYRIPPANMEVKVIRSATPSGHIFRKVGALLHIATGVWQALLFLKKERPSCVAGFGGYPSFPAILAAARLNIPLVIQEQNAFLGKVNRIGTLYARHLATAYETLSGLPESCRGKIVKTGNPVRQAFTEMRGTTHYLPPEHARQPVNLLITGGSQGAAILAKSVPPALVELHKTFPELRITQQCRADECEQVKAFYESHHLAANVVPFIENMPEAMASAHLVIARAGASTIAELTMLGRPAIFVPLPTAADDHQTKNAEALVKHQAAVMIPQKEFTPERLHAALFSLLSQPGYLAEMADNARKCAMPDATERLVQLIENCAR